MAAWLLTLKVNDEELARKIQKEELDGRKRAAKKPTSKSVSFSFTDVSG